jgi:hypothetical protein
VKLPFTFGIRLIFRLILPGLILAAAFYPLCHVVFFWLGAKLGFLTIYPFETVFWGWLIVLLDMPIYMLFEGRRYWPETLISFGKSCELKRLRKLTRKAGRDMRRSNHRVYLEANISLLDFPIGVDGQPTVQYPTKLGNLLAAYESYPSVKYQLDAIFYWPRIWIMLDKDLREEIDTSQSLADSAIYVSFASWVSAATLIFYAMIYPWHARLDIQYLPSRSVLVGLSFLCGVGGYFFYRASLAVNRQYAELFKALFDQFRSSLVFVDDVAAHVARRGGAPGVNRDENYRIVSRYLRWHRIRPPGEQANYTPEAWRERAQVPTLPADDEESG